MNKKLNGVVDLILLLVLVVIFLIAFNKTTDFLTTLIATGIGVFFAFYLNIESKKIIRERIYKSLLKGLILEFKNNIKIINDEGNNRKGIGISFETFKLTTSNEIFIEHFIREKEAGEKTLEEIWDIVTILRKVKEEQEIKKFKEGNIIGFKEYQAILGKLEKLHNTIS